MQNNNTTPPTNPSTPNQPSYTTPKSSVVAGLLGIFLGGFGAHDWYLGNTKKGLIHLCLFGGGLILTITNSALTAAASYHYVPALAIIAVFLASPAYLIFAGNSIWGFIEGVIILAQGDAGLAAKGYTVAPSPLYNPSQVANPATPTGETVKATDHVDDDDDADKSEKTAKSEPKSETKSKSEPKSEKSEKSNKSTQTEKKSDK